MENVWRQRDLSRDENPRKPSPGLPLVLGYTEASRIKAYKKRAENVGDERSSWSSLKAPYPWENAMFSLKGSILSLT